MEKDGIDDLTTQLSTNSIRCVEVHILHSALINLVENVAQKVPITSWKRNYFPLCSPHILFTISKTNSTMNEIKLFNRALATTNRSFKEVNSLAVHKGYIVAKECCNDRVIDYLATLPDNINTTFYASWIEVTGKNRLELAIDQVMHYMSTYGTGHEGTPYVPNDNPAHIDFTDCKEILPISPIEIQVKIQAMLDSGVAMKQDTIDSCVNLASELDLSIDVDTIKNREALIIFCDKLGLLPSSPVEMIRLLVYKATGETLIINSPEVLAKIASSSANVAPMIEEFGIDQLSSVFYRFKRILLAFKKANKNNSKIVNRLRRRAVVNHKPMPQPFWNNILSNTSLLPQLEERLGELNNFRKVRLLQAIAERQKNTGVLPVRVRNGKLFITTRTDRNHTHLNLVYQMIYDSLVDSLSKKACSVKYPKGLNLTMPSSEKAFIGNIPFGSYVETDVDTIVGINWRGADGLRDLDLSASLLNGGRLGWDSDYTDSGKTMVYSGDMTSANPEATELFYCKDGADNSIIKTNLYSGEPGSEYTFFIAKVVNYNKAGRYASMIDPNDVVFSTRLKMDQSEMTNGIFVNDRFIFVNLSSGNARVSRNNPLMINYLKHMQETSDCFLDVEKVLIDAGFTATEDDEYVGLDLSTLDKSSLIDLLG
jgi:hypothetical protein